MPTMAPGIQLWTSLQPLLIGLGNIILVIVLILSVVIALATVAYILVRERDWWREAEPSTGARQLQNE